MKFKRMNCVGNVAHVAETENLTERDHFGRPRYKWEDNIKMNL